MYQYEILAKNKTYCIYADRFIIERGFAIFLKNKNSSENFVDIFLKNKNNNVNFVAAIPSENILSIITIK